jgi:hypothetical protein
MWIAEFDTPKATLNFWLELRRRGLASRMLSAHGQLLVMTREGDGPEVKRLFELFGGRRDDRIVGATDADLFDSLVAAAPLKMQSARSPEVALFLTPHLEDHRALARLLIEQPHQGVVSLALLIEQQVHHLLAVQRLESWLPLSAYLERAGDRVRVLAPVDPDQRDFRPAGCYLEVGYAHPLGRHAAEAFRFYTGARTTALLLRLTDRAIIAQDAGAFVPVLDACRVQLSPLLQQTTAVATPQPSEIAHVEVRVERIPFHEQTPPEIRLRQADETITMLEAQVERLRRLVAAPEPRALMMVPETAEASLRATVRQTSGERLRDFHYFSQTFDTGRMHFLVPAPGVERALFPSVLGAQLLLRVEEWHHHRLEVYVPPGFRLTPQLHFSDAAKIRSALLAKGGAVTQPMFAYFAEPDGRCRQYVVSEQAFVPLADAIGYLNQSVIAAGDEVARHTAVAFEEAVWSHLGAAAQQLESVTSTLIDASDALLKGAREAVDAMLLELDGQLAALSALNERHRVHATTILAANSSMRDYMKGQRESWTKLKTDFAGLCAIVDAALEIQAGAGGTDASGT